MCDFPVNIDTTVKAENCNMYCDYKYDYNDSSCIVSNVGSMLKIKYDLKSDGTVPQAFLNKKKFLHIISKFFFLVRKFFQKNIESE